jgi:hypothetical protein
MLKNICKQKSKISQVQWLTPVNPSYLEAEIGMIPISGQSRQIRSQEPISKEKCWVWWCTPVIPATTGKCKIGEWQSKLGWVKTKSKTLSPK